jgi:hypothetical protein
MWTRELMDVKNCFRVKSGEIEIEYEGPIKDVKALPQKKMRTRLKNEVEESIEGKKSKRGGLRKVIYPPEIQKLKKANFFKPKKSLDDTIKKFESLGVPTRDKRTAIRSALINDAHKKNSTLKATKEGDEWYFWQD